MTVKQIIEEYLKNNGFDGLCGEFCGCGLDDLFACEGCGYSNSILDCKPAYKQAR